MNYDSNFVYTVYTAYSVCHSVSTGERLTLLS